ncbi:MAG: DUF4019 domain-containing protein [Erythrobacter sp.]
MTDALTDKEKEALRLLLDGHDTKSSANVLGLSVYTINDRLRNARRKLGVSSSREAARILRDAEGGTPQNPVHKPLGIADDVPTMDNADLTSKERSGPSRFTWLAGGMFIMSIVIAVAVLTVISTGGSESETAATPSDDASSPTEQTAQTAVDDAESLNIAEPFVAAIDDGDWQESWNAAGEFFQSQATAAEWAQTIEPVRVPLGAVEERRLTNVQRVATLPGAPEGDYEVLQYQTKFANRGPIAIETVIMIKNGATYDVAGYFIR